MPAKRYKVTLEPDERGELEKLISRGKGAARRLAHARILLHADQGEGKPGKIDAEIAEAVGVSVATIERVRQRFVEEGLETALSPRPPCRLYLRKLDGEAEARLIALACSPPPEGRARWTLDSSSNNLNISCCDKLLAGAQAVVPFTMKLVPLEGQFSKLFVRHLEPGFVGILVQLGPNVEPCFGGRAADQIDHDLAADQGASAPVVILLVTSHP